MKTYFNGGSNIVFDYSDIRPKGARLITAGGKAPGPQPLKECLIKIRGILDEKDNGERLTPIEVHDIVCHIADAVLSGGIRRAALISLFSADDNEMIACKTGNWWEQDPQSGMDFEIIEEKDQMEETNPFAQEPDQMKKDELLKLLNTVNEGEDTKSTFTSTMKSVNCYLKG